MRRIRQSPTRRRRHGGVVAAALVSAGLTAACIGGAGSRTDSAAPGSTGVGPTAQPTLAKKPAATATIPSRSPTRPAAHPTVPDSTSRPATPVAPRPAGLRPVAVPAACQLNAPAAGIQRSADDGHLPWRLDPAQVVLQCLRRSLGAAAWRISRTSEHTVAVTEARSRLVARVRLQQPVRQGPGGIWDVTGVDANKELILPPACVEPAPAALQAAFDQGHQPWRADPVTTAQACVAAAYGWRHPRGTLVSANRVSVVDETTGESADVQGRRWRPGGDIWLITSVQRDIGQD